MRQNIHKITDKSISGYAKVLSYYLAYFSRKNIYNFKDVQTMVLTIGFPRSGSSLIGLLLTAHPNIVLPDEATVDPEYGMDPLIILMDELKRPKTRYLYLAELDGIFDYLLCADKLRYLLGTSIFNYNTIPDLKRGSRINRYLFIPNQYQGRFQSLQVIGNKHSQSNVDTLIKEDILKNFRSKLEDQKVSLKFIFTIRNPYDMVATDVRERLNDIYNLVANNIQEWLKKRIANYIKATTKLCENNMKIFQQTDPANVFICKNEDMIENPKLQLTKLCDFLQVPASVDYINACASRVIKKPTKSRFEIDWPHEYKQEVASLIEKYDFFSGYNWQS